MCTSNTLAKRARDDRIAFFRRDNANPSFVPCRLQIYSVALHFSIPAGANQVDELVLRQSRAPPWMPPWPVKRKRHGVTRRGHPAIVAPPSINSVCPVTRSAPSMKLITSCETSSGLQTSFSGAARLWPARAARTPARRGPAATIVCR